MGMQLPDWLRTIFLVATGDGWPEADEDELRALARAWTEVGDAIYTVEQRIVDPVRGVRRTDWDGPAAEAFEAAGGAFVGQGGQQLAGLAQGSQELSDFIYDTAVNVQYMKLIVIGELLILAAQIAYLIAMGPWTFGASTAAVPALQAAGRSFALMAVRQLAISIAAGQVLQVGLDAIVQLTQLALGTRRHWDTKLTGFAAITGVVGGVVGPGLGVLGNMAAKTVRPMLGKTLTAGLKDVIGNAVHEYATSVGTGLVTGQGWIGTPWDLTAGGVEGTLDALGRRRRGLRTPDTPTLPDIKAVKPAIDMDTSLLSRQPESSSGASDGSPAGRTAGVSPRPVVAEELLLAQSVQQQRQSPLTGLVPVAETGRVESFDSASDLPSNDVQDGTAPGGVVSVALSADVRPEGTSADVPASDLSSRSPDGAATIAGGSSRPTPFGPATEGNVSPETTADNTAPDPFNRLVVLDVLPSAEVPSGNMVSPLSARQEPSQLSLGRLSSGPIANQSPGQHDAVQWTTTREGEPQREGANPDRDPQRRGEAGLRADRAQQADGGPQADRSEAGENPHRQGQPLVADALDRTDVIAAIRAPFADLELRTGATGADNLSLGREVTSSRPTEEARRRSEGVTTEVEQLRLRAEQGSQESEQQRPSESTSIAASEVVAPETASAVPTSDGGVDTTQSGSGLAQSEQPAVSIRDTLRGDGDDGGDDSGDSWSLAVEPSMSDLSELEQIQPHDNAAAAWAELRQRLDLPDNQVRQIIKLIRRVGVADESRALETAGVYAELYGQPGSRPRIAGTLHRVRGTDTIIHPRRLTDLHRVMELARRSFPELAGRPGPLSADDLLPVLRRSGDPTAEAVTPQRVERLTAGMRELRHDWRSPRAWVSHPGAAARAMVHSGPPSVRELQRYFVRVAETPAWRGALAAGEFTPTPSPAAQTTLSVPVEIGRAVDVPAETSPIQQPATLGTHVEQATVDTAARLRQLQDGMGLGDGDVRQIVKWIRRGSSPDASGLALETAHLYQELYGNPGGPLQLSRSTNEPDVYVTVVDPKKLADLRRVLDLTRRTFPPSVTGRVAPLSSDYLLPLVRQVLEPDAEAVTRDRLDRLIRGIHEVRHDWRFTTWARRSIRAARPLLSAQSVSAHELERHFRRAARRADGVDGAVNRSAELAHLQVAVSEPRSREAQRYEFGVEDLKGLVSARRAYQPDPRRRGFSGIEDYAPIVRDLLGTEDVDQVTLASLADLARRVRTDASQNRTVTRSRLARALIERDWSDTVRPPAPDVTPGGQTAGLDHNMTVPGLVRPSEIPLADELTDWLNRIVPGSPRVISRENVVDALTRSFASALDEGIPFTVPERDNGPHPAGEKSRLTYVVELYARAVGSASPGASKQLSQGASLTLEQRNAGVEIALTRQRARGSGAHLDVGLVHRMNAEVAQYGLIAAPGVGRETHQVHSAGSATERKEMFKPRGAAVVLDLPVTWSARVREETTGRWRDFVWERSETAGDYHVSMYVQVPPLPDADRDHRVLSSNTELPLWEMNHAVERVVAADRLRAELRTVIGEREYSFWAQEIEQFLSNNQIGRHLADSHRTDSGWQDVPRIMLRRGDRYLNISLTATAVSAENAGPNENNVAFVRESRTISRAAAHKEKLRQWRGKAYGGAGALVVGLLAGEWRGKWLKRRTWSRSHRSMGDRALYVHDTNRVIMLQSQFGLDVHWGDDRQREPRQGRTAPVLGWSHVRVRDSELAMAEASHTAAAEQAPATSAEPSAPRRWWTPQLNGDFGIGFGTPQSLSADGIASVYDQLVPVLVRQGYLPVDALGVGQRTPWRHLQALSRTGASVNRPGVRFGNWRMLVEHLSPMSLVRRVDDLMGTGAGQPGIALAFAHPHPQDPRRSNPLTVGLSARITGAGTHVRTDSLHPTNGWFGTENVGVGRTKGRINRVTVSYRHRADLGLVSEFDDPESEIAEDLPLAEAASIKQWESISHSVRHASTTFMSVMSIPGDAALFQLPITLAWSVHGTTRTHGEVETTMRVWQPTAMTDAGDEPSSPSLGGFSARSREASPSPSPLVGMAIQVPVAVSGVGDLQAAVIEQTGADPHDVWETLTTVRYKSNLTRILSSGEALTVGRQRAMLQAAPIGQAMILQQVTAYVAVMREGDTGEERMVGQLSDQGAKLDAKVTAFHNVGPSITEMRGGGQESRSGTTTGATRVFTTPNREMYVVRTAVRNVVRLSSGRTVSTDGELVLAVPKADVLAKGPASFADPFHLLPAETEAVPPTVRQAPLSLRDGRLWTGLWLQPIGPSALHDAVTRDARALGGNDLLVQVLPLLNGLAAWLPELEDGGRTWQLRSGGYSYEFTVTARAVGESRHIESIEGAHLKLRNRGHNSQGSVAVRRRTTSAGVHAGSGIEVGHEEGMEDPTSQWLSGKISGTWSRKRKQRYGSSIGRIQGERPIDVATFAHNLELSYKLHRLPGGLESVAAILRGPATKRGTIVEEWNVFVPLSATAQLQTSGRGWHETPHNVLPEQSAVLGVQGIAAIAEAVRAHTVDSVRWNDPSVSPLLSTASLVSSFAEMLTEQGAHFAAVASPGGNVKPAGGVTVRARFGELRHIYAVGTSEIEHFDKVSHHNANIGDKAVHGELSVHGNPRMTIVPGLGLSVGLHIDAGINRTIGSGQDTARSNTYLSGQRHRGTTYHLYLPITFIVVVGDAAPSQVTGAAEIIVTETAALTMGIPAELLHTLEGIMTPLRHKEFALD